MRRLLLALAALLAIGLLRPAAADGLTEAALHQPSFRAALPAGHTAYSNESLADLFVTLTHELEWGAQRPNLVRYETPVRVDITGRGAARYAAFLDQYLAELRLRAGVPITRTEARHNLLVRLVPGQAFDKRVPRHRCIVAPGALTWETFIRNMRRYGVRPFEEASAIHAMTVFIPDDAPPYLVRACLVEEIAQALGPANDLYGLGSSIFNDDAAHLWPTKLDFLLLRVLYASELRSGLSRTETRMQALRALDRLNPQGRAAPPLALADRRELAGWTDALRAAFDRSRPWRKRRASAQEALAIATHYAPLGPHHCRSLVALAHASRDDPATALSAFGEAARVCAIAHGPGDIRIAQIRLEQARQLYLGGRASAAWGASEGLEAQFMAHGQEERLAALYDLQAAALRAIQQAPPDAALRRRASEWRAYALGRTDASGRRWIGN